MVANIIIKVSDKHRKDRVRCGNSSPVRFDDSSAIPPTASQGALPDDHLTIIKKEKLRKRFRWIIDMNEHVLSCNNVAIKLETETIVIRPQVM